jgi:nitrite reductase/ring-hydroxylating ferredoxin subunit
MTSAEPATAEGAAASERKYVVARVADVPDGSRLIVDVAGRSVGIFNVAGRFYALLNRCPHMGAELCRGDVIGLVEGDRPGDMRIDTSKLFISCPWHAWEYDLATGQSWINPKTSRVRPYPITVESGEKLAGDVAAGVVCALHAEPDTFDMATHRVKGRLVAQVVPIEIQDEHIVLSLSRIVEPE